VVSPGQPDSVGDIARRMQKLREARFRAPMATNIARTAESFSEQSSDDWSSERNQKLLTLSLRCSRRHKSHAVRKHGSGMAGNPHGISTAMCIKNEGG
jgi:5-methylthioribose kinase